jgi:hypothetical protein
MPAVKLTKQVLDGLQKAPPSVRTPYWDAQLRRFGAIAYPTGAITFVVQYRNASGVTRKYKVGLSDRRPLSRRGNERARCLVRWTKVKIHKKTESSAERA